MRKDIDRMEANGGIVRSATVPAWCELVPVIISLAMALVVSQRADGRLHMWVLDVGEGDAILLRTPAGHNVLTLWPQ